MVTAALSIIGAVLMVCGVWCVLEMHALQVAYFAEGGGKFVEEFVSIPSVAGLPGTFWGAGVLMAISLSYTLVPRSLHSQPTDSA